MDEYDKKLLFELDRDCRQTLQQLGRKVGLSKDAIKNRIEKLENDKIIEGYYALINSAKLGFYSVRIYFSFRNTTPEIEQEIITNLMGEKSIFYLARIEGAYDMGFGYFSKSLSEFTDFWRAFRNKHGKSIDNIKQGVFTYLAHFDRNYLSKNQKNQAPKVILGEPEKEDIDKIDETILNILSNNARTKIIDICSKANITAKAIIRRIKILENKKIILGYKSKINTEMMGYSMYKTDMQLSDFTAINKIEKFVQNLPNIIHYEISFGGSDIEFDLECRNYEEYFKIINDIKNFANTSISRITHYRATTVLKTRYL